MRFILAAVSLLAAGAGAVASAQNLDTLTLRGESFILADIPGGSFMMGDRSGGSYEDLIGESRDEFPVHKVTLSPFRMGTTEVTNAQFELFFPEHRALRGIEGFSTGDDDAVVNVSWHQAMLFCRMLSESTGRSFRLPTEAEWEYACKAGTTTDFWSGNVLPFSEWKHQRTERYKVPVSLRVARGRANPFGLYDMHGNVEEWCMDWYGPYSPEEQKDPQGPSDGDFRVTRGGSHNTPERYLRSVNRMAMQEDDWSVMTGFRIVEAAPAEFPYAVRDLPHKPAGPSAPERVEEPFFATPVPYVIPPADPSIPFYSHNHQPAVVWTEDGLLAIWFSCEAESGREMVVLCSRWSEKEGWSPAELFFDAPDRNMTGAALLRVSDYILHIAGVGDAGEWRNLVILTRKSYDEGLHWSAPVLAGGWHRERHQVIAGPVLTEEGFILLGCDAGPGGEDGTALHYSSDGGDTFVDTGDTIAGIHAGIVTLPDGAVMAFGRGNSIDGRMPCSISCDGGASWAFSATEFPPIGSGQRLVLKRLDEGPLLLCSFGENGLFAALSYDDGKTWPLRKLLTDGSGTVLDGGAWTGQFVLDGGHGEPAGYLAVTQSPDGVIHLLSSRVHYRFNLRWLED